MQASEQLKAIKLLTAKGFGANGLTENIAKNIKMFVKEPEFYTLKEDLLMKILKQTQKLDTKTATDLVVGLNKTYGLSSLHFLPVINVGAVGEEAADILEPLLSCPLLGELARVIHELTDFPPCDCSEVCEECFKSVSEFEARTKSLEAEVVRLRAELAKFAPETCNCIEADELPYLERPTVKSDPKLASLFKAIEEGNLDQIGKLAKECNCSGVNESGMTPLCLACYAKDKDIIEEIIGAGADVNMKDSNGIPPIVYACERECPKGCMAAVEALLEHGASVGAGGGWTALHSATIAGHADVCELLVKSGADRLAAERSVALRKVVKKSILKGLLDSD